MTSIVPVEIDPDPATPGAISVRVTVEIDGVARRMILDTGGARSTLPAAAVPGAADVADPSEAGHGVFGSAAVRRVRVGSLRLGDLIVEGPVFDVMADPVAPPVLGLDVLGAHRLSTRWSDGLVELDGDTAVDRRRALVRSSRGHPYVQVAWGDLAAPAVWDSGASVTVVDRSFAAARPDLFTPDGLSTGTDAGGARAESEMVRMAPLVVGGRIFDATPAAVVDLAGIVPEGDPPFDLILGMPVLVQTDWVLDLAEGWWGFRV